MNLAFDRALRQESRRRSRPQDPSNSKRHGTLSGFYICYGTPVADIHDSSRKCARYSKTTPSPMRSGASSIFHGDYREKYSRASCQNLIPTSHSGWNPSHLCHCAKLLPIGYLDRQMPTKATKRLRPTGSDSTFASPLRDHHPSRLRGRRARPLLVLVPMLRVTWSHSASRPQHVLYPCIYPL